MKRIRNNPERKTIIEKRAKKPNPRAQSMSALYADIDAGYRYFWKRRSGVPHLAVWSVEGSYRHFNNRRADVPHLSFNE